MPIHQNWNASGRHIGFNELPTQRRQGSKLVFCQLAWWAAWKPGLSGYASSGQPCHADCPVVRDHKAPKALVPLFYPELSSQLCKRKTKNRGNAGGSVSTRPIPSPNLFWILLLVQWFCLFFCTSSLLLLFFIPHWERIYIFLKSMFHSEKEKILQFFPPSSRNFLWNKRFVFKPVLLSTFLLKQPLCCLSSLNKMEPHCSAAFQALHAEERRTWPIVLRSVRETWTTPLRGGII